MGLISFIRINLVTDKNDVRTAILRTRVWHATVRMADIGNDCSVERSFEFCVYVFPFFIFGNFLSRLANSAHADNTQILILQLCQRIQCIRHFQRPAGFKFVPFCVDLSDIHANDDLPFQTIGDFKIFEVQMASLPEVFSVGLRVSIVEVESTSFESTAKMSST